MGLAISVDAPARSCSNRLARSKGAANLNLFRISQPTIAFHLLKWPYFGICQKSVEISTEILTILK